MKKTFLACLAAAVIAAQSAYAISIVTFTDRSGSPGGEFGADLGANVTLDFVTSCIEANEYINPYNSTIYHYGFRDVGVRNLYSRLTAYGTFDYSSRIQDQLTPLPSRLAVPDGGTTLSLLGLAMTGVALMNRRFRKN